MDFKNYFHLKSLSKSIFSQIDNYFSLVLSAFPILLWSFLNKSV